MKTKILLFFIGVSWLAGNAVSQPVETSKVIGTVPGAVEKVQKLAASGDAGAQKTLAEWLFAGEVVKKDWVQSYKWAFVAVSQGNKEAKHVLRELDLFASVEDKKQGRALGEQYIAERKKSTEKPKVEASGPKK